MSVPFKKAHEREYGVQACNINSQNGEVVNAKCLFCVYFGKDVDDSSRKRKATAHVKYYKKPFRVQNYKSHLKQHFVKWQEYQQLSNDEKDSFFKKVNVPYVNTLDSHFDFSSREEQLYVIDSCIVDSIIDNLMFDPEDEENVSKQQALSIFKRSADTNTYNVKIKNFRQFVLIQGFVGFGATFRLAKNIMDCTKTVTNIGYLSGISVGKIIQYVRIAVARALQICREIMLRSWTYSVALDASNKGTSAYLDVRIRIYWNGKIENIHILAIPMFDRHTGEYMHIILCKLLDALDTDWKLKIVGATTDGAANMTGNQRGVVTRLENDAFPGFYKVWCALHQLDLRVQSCVTKYYNDEYYSSLTGVIGYLRRQYNLIEEMNSKCPKVADTRWLSLGKVCKWLLENRVRVLEYFDSKKPSCAPTGIWWIYLAVCDVVIKDVNMVFVAGQGMNTLLCQQLQYLDKLKRLLISRIGATRPLLNAADGTEDDCLQKGDYIVRSAGAINVIRDCGLYFEHIYNALTLVQKATVWKDVAMFVLSMIDGIQTIERFGNVPTNVNLPPVLPHQLVRIRSYEFNAIVNEQLQRYSTTKTAVDFQRVQEQHRLLSTAYSIEDVLHQQMELQNDHMSFEEGWKVVDGRFKELQEFCGGLATIFPGTSTVESDFSIINYEKNQYRSALTDLSLEGILHCKQFPKLQKLQATI